MTDSFLLAQEQLAREQELEEYERQQAAQEQASHYAPEVAGKQGPAFVPGASEEAEAEIAAVEEEDKSFLSNVIDKKQESLDQKIAVVQGLGDTAVGLAGMAENVMLHGQPGVIEQYIKPFWHENNPESDNPINHTIRKLSGVVIPAIVAPQAIASKLAAAPFAAALPTAVKTTGAIAARIGVDTTIVAASTSADDENAAKALNDAFGWNIPWATREGAGPDERRWYNLAENAGFAGFGELVSGIFALRTYLKGRPKKNQFEASWIHKHDIEKRELLKGGVAPGTQIQWDPGLIAIPKTEEAVEQLTKVADNIAQQTTSPAIKAIDDQIDALGLLD